MKILIVGQNATTKCAGIIGICKKRRIEVDVATYIVEANSKIIFKEEMPDAIILDMNLPIHVGEKVKEHSGETMFLRPLIRKGHDTPVLVFSDTQPWSNYPQVFDYIKDWEKKSQEKFSEFLNYVSQIQKKQPC